MGASVFLKSVDFTAFAVNVKTIAPKKYLYQFGHAIWWGEMPMPVYTFLEGHDFSGKTVIPFCTHAGSGLSGTEKSIENVCAGSEILGGLSIKGEDAQNSQDKVKETVKEWLNGLSY